MGFFDTVSEFFNIVWSSVSEFPILNTGMVFKDVFFGFLGLSVLGFLLSSLFGFSPKGPSYGVSSRSKERISDSRRYDER